MKISVLSRQYVELDTTLEVAGVETDPTDTEVEFAFVAEGASPEEGDYVAGSWETGVDEYVAQVLIGPGSSKELAAGTYDAWIRITDSPEIVVGPVGKLRVF